MTDLARAAAMAFRRATSNDAEAIVRFWQDSGASMSVTDEAGYVRRVAQHPAAIFVLAVAGPEIIGSLLGTFDGWRGNMYRLVVHPRHRRQGIGRELVRHVERAFAELDVRRITVLVEVDRPGAMAFWSAVGYPRDEHVIRHLGIIRSRSVSDGS
jgi:ribosomal protein S18 acetylase RimI-like enzyme